MESLEMRENHRLRIAGSGPSPDIISCGISGNFLNVSGPTFSPL